MLQEKHYPRDWFIRCRLRVEIKRADGAFHNPEITNRERDWEGPVQTILASSFTLRSVHHQGARF